MFVTYSFGMDGNFDKLNYTVSLKAPKIIHKVIRIQESVNQITLYILVPWIDSK